MKRIYILLINLILTLLLNNNVNAANRYWIAGAASNWNNTANWSITNGGTGGASIPTTSDVAIFNTNGLGNCNIDIVVNIGGITINGYTNTIDLLGFTFTTSGTVLMNDGNINDTPGTGSFNVNSTGTTTFNGTTFGVIVDASSARLYLNGSIFNSTSTFIKTGTGNDNGTGGNTFNSITSITNSGTGHFSLGNTNPDIFNADLIIDNNGSNITSLANNSLGNQFNGNIILNSISGTGIYFGNGGGISTLAVTKTVNIGLNGFSTGQLRFRNFTQIGNTAQALTLTGTALLSNYDANWGGDVAFIAPRYNTRGTLYNRTAYIEKTGATDDASVGGNTFTMNTDFVNSGSGYLMMGNGTADTYSADVTLNNIGSRHIYLAQDGNGHIVTGNLTATNTGSGTSAILISSNATASLTVNGNINITQNGTGNALTTHLGGQGDITANGNVTMLNAGTGNSSIMRVANNTSSSVSIMGNTLLTQNGTGNTSSTYLGDRGDIIANGNVTMFNSGSGTSSIMRVANNVNSSVFIMGNTLLNQNGTGTTLTTYLGEQGGVVANGNVTMLNSGTGATSDMRIANSTSSIVSIAGATLITNNNTATTTNRMYIGEQGDITFNGTLDLINNAGVTNSEIYCNRNVNSNNNYNENVTVQTTNATSDGIRFGGSNGTGTLAATKTITIGTGGFIAGELRFRNFTQIGNTAQALTLTGTALLSNYDANWGGDVTFIAPRNNTRGTLYHRTAYIEKTGAIDDASTGGNTFTMDVDFVNSGSGFLMMGNGTADIYSANVSLNNTGSRHIYFAHNSIGNIVTGDLIATNTGSGTSAIFISNSDTATLTVNGNIDLTQNGTGNALTTYLGDQGSITANGNVTMINSGSGTSSIMRIANNANSSVSIMGNTLLNQNGTGTTLATYLGERGDIVANGTVTMLNSATGTSSDMRIANSTSSTVSIAGATLITNNNTATATNRMYIGEQGDITFNGTLDLINNAGVTNSQIYCNRNVNSNNNYNENITLQTTNVNSDGIRFGENSGTGILAANKMITIGTGGFIAGELRFRNFTQIGNTAQALTLTGTALLSNYDANWGGDVTFIAPRYNTRGTLYNRTAYIEKTGATDDASVGGNTFTMNADFVNSGSGYLMMGNGTADIYSADVTLNNIGSRHIYLAQNGNGHIVTGDLTATNTGSGTSAILISNSATATLTVNGNINITQNGTGNALTTHLGGQGDITANGNVTMLNSGSGTSSIMRVANNTSSSVSIMGNTSLTQNGTGNTLSTYLGEQGDIIANGNVTMFNSGSGTTSDMRVANNANSSVSIMGNTLLTQNGTGTTLTTYLASQGGIVANGNVTMLNSGTGTTSDMRIANSTSSSVSIAGATLITNNNTATTTNRMYIGEQGDITFNGTLDLINNAGVTNSQIYCNRSNNSNNTYNENVTVQTTNANSDGIRFGGNNGTGTLAATKTITIGTGGFIAGELRFRNFTQTGNTTHALTLTGTALLYNYDANWGGDVTFIAPRHITRGTLYNRTAYIEKTGATDDVSAGGNTFTMDVDFVNSGSGYLMMGNGTFDTYSANVSLNNTGSRHIYFAQNGNGHMVAGDLTATNTGSGTSAIFISNSANATLTVNGDIDLTQNGTGNALTTYLGDQGDITANGNVTMFNSGIGNSSIMRVANNTNSSVSIMGNTLLNQNGTGNILATHLGSQGDITVNGNVTMFNSGSGTTSDIRIANNTNSNVSILGNTLLTQDGTGNALTTYLGNQGDITANGTVTMLNAGTGTTSEMRIASNVNSMVSVTGATLITNNNTATTTNRIYLGEQGDITFNGTLDLINNAGTTNSQIYCNRSNNSNNTYNEDVTLQTTNANSDGIRFGENSGTGILAANKMITIGTGGFIAGELRFRNFTQIGNTTQALTLTGTALFYNYDADWGGDVTFIAPRNLTRGTLYNRTVYLEKTGGTNDASTGGNIFNGNTTFLNSGTDYFMPANGTGNDFNADVTYTKTNTGLVFPSYNSASTYAGDITINSATTVRFGANTNGRVIFDGNSNQSIDIIGATPTPEFRDIQTNNPNNEITLNTSAIILLELDLDQGNIITNSTNLLYMNDNSTVSSVSDNAFIDGPLEKIGNDAFTFPVGDSSYYRPISMSSPSSSSARFRGEYFKTTPDSLYSRSLKDPSLDHISNCEYWLLDRIASTNDVSVSLSWGDTATSCGITNISELNVARWDGTIWKDHGNGGTTGNLVSGTVITSAPVTSFSPFTLGSSTSANPLPIELISFNAQLSNNLVNLTWKTASEINNDYFTLEKSRNGIDWNSFSEKAGAGNSNTILTYEDIDYTPYQGVSYYRLKQTDFDGKFDYSNIVSIKNINNSNINLYPNPFSDHLIIDGITTENLIKIYSADGKLIFNGNTKKINTNNWSKGLYNVLILDNTNAKLNTFKIIK